MSFCASRFKTQTTDVPIWNSWSFLGINQIPFARVFTKSDKLNQIALEKSIIQYNTEMLEKWESLPVYFYFISSQRNWKG